MRFVNFSFGIYEIVLEIFLIDNLFCTLLKNEKIIVLIRKNRFWNNLKQFKRYSVGKSVYLGINIKPKYIHRGSQ